MDYKQYDDVTKQRLVEAGNILNYKPNNKKFLHMHQSTAKTRLILGGKRSGKTQWGAVECVWAGLGIHPYRLYPDPPLKIRICGVSYNEGVKGILLPALYYWLPAHSVKKFWAEDRILELVNGTIFEFKSYDQDLEKYEGAERHLVWMDEEPPKDKYQSNWWRTISGGIDGKLLITCTPLHGMTWLYDELYDNEKAVPPYVEHIHVSIYENPHLSKEAIDQVLHDPSMQDCLEAAIEGKFISRTGLVYPQFDGDIHIIDKLGEIPDNWMIVVGIDPHDRNPHGVAFVAITPDNEYIVFDEILEHCILEQLVAKIKEKLVSRWPPQLAIMDTYGNIQQSISGRSIKEELTQRHGMYVLDAHKDVRAGRDKIAMVLSPKDGGKPKLRVTSNCYNTIREFRHHVWDDWARRREKRDPKEAPIKKDDHLLDAIRYIVMANIVYRHPGFTRSKEIKRGEPNPVTGYA